MAHYLSTTTKTDSGRLAGGGGRLNSKCYKHEDLNLESPAATQKARYSSVDKQWGGRDWRIPEQEVP